MPWEAVASAAWLSATTALVEEELAMMGDTTQAGSALKVGP